MPKTGSNFCVVPVPDTDPNWNGVAAGVEAPTEKQRKKLITRR